MDKQKEFEERLAKKIEEMKKSSKVLRGKIINMELVSKYSDEILRILMGKYKVNPIEVIYILKNVLYFLERRENEVADIATKMTRNLLGQITNEMKPKELEKSKNYVG
jgi:Glu-tRNA(Gln) amidotransferase subunit E-like FAD-binding protein